MSGAVRASAYSNFSMRSWSEVDTELSVVMRDLHKHFKPIFDQHGEEGLRVKKLTDELESRASQHLMSRQQLLQVLRNADRDGDDYLSYNDFIVMVTTDLKHERQLAFRGMLMSALGSVGVLPKEKRDNFLANSTLCPPPLFIPLITVLQIVIFIAYAVDMVKRGQTVEAASGYPTYSPLVYLPRRRYQAWRFFTYQLIHDGSVKRER